MYSTISFRSQIWLPDVRTSAPWPWKSRHIWGVTPKPAAAFSTFTTVQSISCSRLSRGRSVWSARRPGSPNTSPTMRMFIRLPCDLHRPGLADHDHLDVAGVLHLGHIKVVVIRETRAVEVAHDVRLRHDAQLATRLDRVAHLDSLVRHRD